MTLSPREQVIASFKLTDDQRAAAVERGRDVVVTAGAGSGKTLTLVARYASLLGDGLSPRRVTAITFTEKAAREMRSRVRQAVNDQIGKAVTESEAQRWIGLNAEMDSARIGTIHSLCAEILRAHPAEAGIDPRFDVLDEGNAAALQVQVVADTLAGLVDQEEFIPVFEILKVKDLREILSFLLEHRLEAQEMIDHPVDGDRSLRQFFAKALNNPIFKEGIQELSWMDKQVLFQDAGEKLALQIDAFLELWAQASQEIAAGSLAAGAGLLFRARREKMMGNIGKAGTAKAALKELREAYDLHLNPLVGGAGASDPPPDPESETRFAQALPLVIRAYQRLASAYQQELRQRRALDFDDLEYGAALLLKNEDIRARWQAEMDAVLVDEFQDTNHRQFQIIEALAGAPGRLFVVGDARQSIYRFRRADVTVFRNIQKQVQAKGRLVIPLDQTYRTHEPLLSATGDLLKIIMGSEEDPAREYAIPFTPLKAHRDRPPDHIKEPHIELVLGAGEDTASARPAAARALAERLLELKTEGQICKWDNVALLLHASTGFAHYENAFEDAGIPFVTVAGRGFYDRSEIRDVLNLLRALANPADDLAMAGALRSPAFGLTDAALYLLRWQKEHPTPYWTALQADLSFLNETDLSRAVRARAILQDLLPRVDRIPVTELLKSVVDATDYRAILAAADGASADGRLWRNLDKLLADAQSSGQINVRDFLEYLVTLNDAGAREGEAPTEALGAVRLMTIHKAKGLEFPVVVLADASREPRGASETAYLLPETGLAFRLDPSPLLFNMAKLEDKAQNEAETKRLLYVALTRARDKLIINGHVTASSAAWKGAGWTKAVCEAIDLDVDSLDQTAGTPILIQTQSGMLIRACCRAEEETPPGFPRPDNKIEVQETDDIPLYQPLAVPPVDPSAVEEAEEPLQWRATGPGTAIPPEVVGQMVHKAIEFWLLPGDERLYAMLRTAAQSAGVSTKAQQEEVIQRAVDLLLRLKSHSLRTEIEDAAERYHELPYSRMVQDHPETGYIDLVFLSPAGLQIVDFKTDSIRSAEERARLVVLYSRQMRQYISAVEELTGQQALGSICFLDDHGRVEVIAAG